MNAGWRRAGVPRAGAADYTWASLIRGHARWFKRSARPVTAGPAGGCRRYAPRWQIQPTVGEACMNAAAGPGACCGHPAGRHRPEGSVAAPTGIARYALTCPHALKNLRTSARARHPRCGRGGVQDQRRDRAHQPVASRGPPATTSGKAIDDFR